MKFENKTLCLDGNPLTLDDFKYYLQVRPEISLDISVITRLQEGRDYIEEQIRHGKVMYGVNTGFGHLAQVRIPDERLDELQVNLIRSHAAGVGPLIEADIVRLMMLIKTQSLIQGFSGVRPLVVEQLVFFLNHDILPCIPSKGSVGASGDLAPLAHMTLPLIGEGKVMEKGRERDAAEVLRVLNREPLTLKAKEGLAIINGTQSMTAHGVMALIRTENILYSGELIFGLSLDAMKASLSPFHRAIHEAKGSPFNAACADRVCYYLQKSEINRSHEYCDKVQDPYCFRCYPQVCGAVWEAYDHVKNILIREANGVSDNPLIFREDDLIVSGGNFHGESPALAMDYLAMAVSEIASIAERRIAELVDSHMSRLPAFLVEDSGVNSGFMIAHVTAAALVSENKGLATPASVDSIPTSANQEDHVSMGHRSARKLLEIIENTEIVLAIEYLAAAEGIDYHRPLKTSPVLEKIHQRLRQDIPHLEKDRLMYEDIRKTLSIIKSGYLQKTAKR
ncbi:TPA: histidine ammonia-lyase [Candidatus Marinimicrobia bacterium]|nr:MAG: Histidine ammonia-lyase [Marinimicrobia bacterium 46_47]KUK93501.1 MAG: Histidine ammonia-lyase [Marinimicrobia bacterium 46_43]HAE87542.1 histidine ammonia-lyase [Candidatus Neomarinimicrobiota bacterium]HBY17735.1 histidine ammonia-lyase [Candidatus Neomarinimicrobiota bacterium]